MNSEDISRYIEEFKALPPRIPLFRENTIECTEILNKLQHDPARPASGFEEELSSQEKDLLTRESKSEDKAKSIDSSIKVIENGIACKELFLN